MKRLAAETIGTFVLVFIGTGAIIFDHVSNGRLSTLGISIAFGVAVCAMILVFGGISGAHINPAVSIGLFVAGRFSHLDLLPYIGAQIFGAVAASAVLKQIYPDAPAHLGATLPAGSNFQCFCVEGLMSAILMGVVLVVSTHWPRERWKVALAAGVIVGCEAFWGGPVTGASMNPARSFGPALLCMDFRSHWIYWLAPISGCIVAAQAWRYISTQNN